jgi:nickel/cobalt transporter (NicO) family protein
MSRFLAHLRDKSHPIADARVRPRARRESASRAWLVCVLLCCVALIGLAYPAFAQGAHHPFAVGANEGAVGRVSGITAWIIAQESGFYRLLTNALREAKENGAALWALIGLSLGYGIFHAAGPGHGKAVIASYMVSNERALRRGLVIALLAALLQGAVAVGLVGIAAAIFASTAHHMTEATRIMEVASYCGITLLGIALLWSKGSALLVTLRKIPAPASLGIFAAARPSLALASGNQPNSSFQNRDLQSQNVQVRGLQNRGFVADDCRDDHVHGANCGHFHAPDPRLLGEGFSWRSAAVTVLTAGARPCSGAILVLVFAFAQNIFWAGAAATFAMSLGTAVTTGALASMAVLAKGWALRVTGTSSWRAEMISRGIEVAAALCVIIFGGALLLATLSGLKSGT